MTTSTKRTTASLLGLALGLALLAPAAARADAISDLFNTGVDASHAVLPNLTSPDPHYTIIPGIDGSTVSATIVQDAVPVSYTAANTTSAWIEASPNTQNAAYDYQTTFTLPAGATNLAITGTVGVDNALVGVKINGVSVASYASGASLTNLTANNSNAFTNFNPVSFTIPDVDLLTGTNTLTFLTTNQLGTEVGFRVDSLAGTFTPVKSTPSPSPSLSSPSATTLLLRRRKA